MFSSRGTMCRFYCYCIGVHGYSFGWNEQQRIGGASRWQRKSPQAVMQSKNLAG
jgi:phage replication-related protein YjqB (UPF0714/DUF867 family)